MSWIQIGFVLGFFYVIYLLFKSDSQGTRINNKIHRHSLVKDKKCKGSYTCKGCKMNGIGTRYRCSRSCKFYLHLECMHAEKELAFQEQKFHLHTTPNSCTGKDRSCDACEKKVKGYLYHCLRTDQVFHPRCFPKFEYCPRHWRYVLVKDKTFKGSYNCNECLMKGTGRRYRCGFRSCNFELHFECMHAEKERTFQEQKYELLPKPKCTMGVSCAGKCMSCDTCDKKVDGRVYHCSKTDQVFHPVCFPNYHPSHDHGLVKDENCKDIYECDRCLMEGTGRRYRCKFQRCFQLHFECMHAEEKCTFRGRKCELLEKLLPCELCQKKEKDNCKNLTQYCNACGERVKGLVYHCSDTGEYFHPTCTKLESSLSHEGVTFSLKDERGTSVCALCGKMARGNKIRGWSYISRQGECIHVCCLIDLKNELSNKISKGDSSLPLAQRMKLPLHIKSKGKSKNKWMKILEFILKTLISILTGHPTEIVVSFIDFVIKDG